MGIGCSGCGSKHATNKQAFWTIMRWECLLHNAAVLGLQGVASGSMRLTEGT